MAEKNISWVVMLCSVEGENISWVVMQCNSFGFSVLWSGERTDYVRGCMSTVVRSSSVENSTQLENIARRSGWERSLEAIGVSVSPKISHSIALAGLAKHYFGGGVFPMLIGGGLGFDDCFDSAIDLKNNKMQCRPLWNSNNKSRKK